MKKKILSLSIITILTVMLFLLTGCTDNQNVENENNHPISEKDEEQNDGALQELTEKNLTELIKIEDNNSKKTNSELQVGEYTLKYGTYTGTDAQYDDIEGVISWDITITLKEDGTYTLTSSNQDMEKDSTGTYTITNKYGFTGILLSNQRIFSIVDNNTLQVPAGSGATLTYQEN